MGCLMQGGAKRKVVAGVRKLSGHLRRSTTVVECSMAQPAMIFWRLLLTPNRDGKLPCRRLCCFPFFSWNGNGEFRIVIRVLLSTVWGVKTMQLSSPVHRAWLTDRSRQLPRAGITQPTLPSLAMVVIHFKNYDP